jgi:hypothetical protein
VFALLDEPTTSVPNTEGNAALAKGAVTLFLVSPRACSALAGTIDLSTDGILFACRHRERRHPVS